MNPGSFRVLHLLHHVRLEALNLKDYGQGDPYMADHCDVDWATTWARAADELRVCFAGPIGDELEAMCRITVELIKRGKLGPRPANWSEERAALSWTKNRMSRWLDDRYPSPHK